MLSPPPGLSQSATSFIASCCQGIHQTPLSRLIRSRRRRALLREAVRTSTRFLRLDAEVFDPGNGPSARGPPGQRAPNDPEGSDEAHGQCHLTWKDCCSRLGPRGPRPAPAPLGRCRTASRVFCSLHDVSELPRSRDRTGRLVVKRACQSDRPRSGRGLVGRGGVEPPTSRLSGVRSNHLSYRPQSRGGRLAPRLLVEPTGIEPVTSSLQS